MIRPVLVTAVLILSLFAVGLTAVSPAAAQETVSVDVVGGNDITVRANNVKRDNAVVIPFDQRTAAEQNFGIDLDEMEVWTVSDMSGFNLDLDVGASPPSGVSSIEGVRSLTYLTVETQEISDEDIDELRFRFSVYKNRLEQLQGGSDDVVLHRYSGGEWNQITLSVSDETTDRFRYEAELPGFSTFSIGVQQPVFEVSEASVSDDLIGEGGTVDVTATVQNTGMAEGTLTLNLREDGELVDSESVSVGPGSSQSVTFTRTFDTLGVYELTVNNVSAGEVRVESGAGAGDSGGGDGGNASDDGGGSELPGFGVLAALAAVTAVVVLRLRR